MRRTAPPSHITPADPARPALYFPRGRRIGSTRHHCLVRPGPSASGPQFPPPGNPERGTLGSMEQLPLWGGRSTVSPRHAIPLLSKSRFMAGLQCKKRLYLECYEGTLREDLSPATRALFDAGARVGLVARGLFADGVKVGVEGMPHEEAVQSTLQALAPGSRAIYEAAFKHDNIRIRVDILAPAGSGAWDLVEVKSSSGFKEEYLPDVGIQLHVLEGAGVPIRRVCVVHVNSQYVYEGGPYELNRLFAVRDVTAEARKALPRLRAALEEMRAPLWAWAAPD